MLSFSHKSKQTTGLLTLLDLVIVGFINSLNWVINQGHAVLNLLFRQIWTHCCFKSFLELFQTVTGCIFCFSLSLPPFHEKILYNLEVVLSLSTVAGLFHCDPSSSFNITESPSLRTGQSFTSCHLCLLLLLPYTGHFGLRFFCRVGRVH